MTQLEKNIQSSIMNYFKSLKDAGHPVYVEKRQAGGYTYKIGLPDIYAVYNGRHIEIEVKRPGGQRRACQEKWQEIFESINIIYVCADNLDTVKELMNKLIKGER